VDRFSLLGRRGYQVEKKFCRVANAVSVVPVKTRLDVGTMSAFLQLIVGLAEARQASTCPAGSARITIETARLFMEVGMLVLSRKLNEKIIINGNITITVVKIDRNQVRLGIEAPGEIPVYREEILPVAVKEARDAQALAVCS
jgi:carbon storage regulator